MTSFPTLQQIAREKNWMTLALMLETAMDRHESYGLPDPNAVRATVGRMRRQLPSSLSAALKAMQFLRERHAGILAGRDKRIGCVHVRLLARIEEISPAAAAKVEGRVFAGEIRQVDLREYFYALRPEAEAEDRKRGLQDGPRPASRLARPAKTPKPAARNGLEANRA